MPRRAHTSTPPNPASDIWANATNSSSSEGAVIVVGDAAMGAEGETGGILDI
jgi:hypothetical protein